MKKFSNKRILLMIILFFILFEFNFFILTGLARKESPVSGFSKKSEIGPGETKSYRFSNNIRFEITSNVNTSFKIEYSEKIKDREISIDIENNKPISTKIEAKSSLESFGVKDIPKEPRNNYFQYITRYECVYKLRSNVSIEKIELSFEKSSELGFDPLIGYSIAFYEEEESSWEILNTEEKVDNTDSTVNLEGDIEDLSANTDYYITIYEISYWNYVWIGLIIIIAISVLSVIIILSKKDYFHYLKTRTIPIEKGAHRLNIDEVLENENRNKIIDMILEEPGIHFNELLRKTELAPGNLVWHLDILETYKVIGRKRIGNFIAYFPYYQKNPISNIDLKLSKSKLTFDILQEIENQPGLWNDLITKKFKVDHKTIHYHVKKLEELGIIKIKKDGRKRKIYPDFDSEYYKEKDNLSS